MTDTRLLLYALAAVAALMLLIARFKLHPPLSLWFASRSAWV